MKQFVKENWESLLLLAASSASIAYGMSSFIPFEKGFMFLLPISFILFHLFQSKQNREIKSDVSNVVENFQAILDDQEQIIKEYEAVFDAQLVELPCVCGGNTFQGLFSPNTENIVECEKCNNKYRVNVSYDSILISNPLDINQTFDDLVGKI